MPRLPALPTQKITVEWRDPEPGYWMMYVVRGGVTVPARIWWCNHEPGNEENALDRWPIPFLAGEIGGKWLDPKEIWLRVLMRDSAPNHWRCAQPMRPKEGLTEEEEYRHLMNDMAWLKKNEPGDPHAKPYKPVKLSTLPLPF
jgi:hypothetical protein